MVCADLLCVCRKRRRSRSAEQIDSDVVCDIHRAYLHEPSLSLVTSASTSRMQSVLRSLLDPPVRTGPESPRMGTRFCFDAMKIALYFWKCHFILWRKTRNRKVPSMFVRKTTKKGNQVFRVWNGKTRKARKVRLFEAVPLFFAGFD